MKKTKVAKGPQEPKPSQPMRRSSYRRQANLRTLVAEFALRDIGSAGVALLLDCSISAARNYIIELVDAGVLVSHPVRQRAGGVDRTPCSAPLSACPTGSPTLARAPAQIPPPRNAANPALS